jgi:hypothetical protein
MRRIKGAPIKKNILPAHLLTLFCSVQYNFFIVFGRPVNNEAAADYRNGLCPVASHISAHRRRGISPAVSTPQFDQFSGFQGVINLFDQIIV